MIRNGQQYRDSIRDGRQVWINGERVRDVASHTMFKPLVDIRARIYDMAHEAEHAPVMAYRAESGEPCAIGAKLPLTQEDWHAKRAAVDTVLDDIGGIVTRVGDETVGEMWSLYDGQDLLNEVNPQFAANIRRHVEQVVRNDPFHVSANTDPKGDRSKRPQDQDPDMLLHVVKETDAGIIVRGAKYETAAAYANQAFTKPTIANWGNSQLSDYAVGFICNLGAPNLKFICRTGFAGRAPAEDYPLSNRFDEVDTLLVFDNVLIPWEDVLFYRHTKAATFIRATLHRYSAFAFVQRTVKLADFMIGAALFNARQTGLDQPAGGAGKAGAARVLSRGHQCAPDRRDRLCKAQPGRAADAGAVAADDRAGAGVIATASHDAYRAGTVRRADLRHAGRRGVPRSGNGALAGEVLQRQRRLAARGPPQAAGLRT